jgi:hypothetical protein
VGAVIHALMVPAAGRAGGFEIELQRRVPQLKM